MSGTLSARSSLDLFPERASVGPARYAFYHVYVACTLGANAVVLIPVGPAGQVGGNAVFAASWAIMHLLVYGLLLITRRQDGTNLFIGLAVGFFVVASTVWSVAPTSTLAYGGMLAGNVMAAHLMANDLSVAEILKVISRTILFLCVAGIVAYYLGYRQVYYFDEHGRANILGGEPLRGFFPHKIMASLYATLGAAAALSSVRRGWRRLVAVIVLAWFVALTGSATGLVLALLAIAVYGGVLWCVRKRWSGTWFLIASVVFTSFLGVLVATNWSSILAELGRDGTLTGRTVLWQYGLNVAGQRPWLGWGFNGYFSSSLSSSLSAAVPAFRHYDVPHFHESWIQTATDLGIVGVLLAAAIVVCVLWWSYKLALVWQDASGVSAFTMCATLIVASATMYIFLTYNHFGTFSLFLLFFALGRARRSVMREEQSATGG